MTIERQSFDRDMAQLKSLVQERQAEILVVGLPYSMDGSLGFQAKRVQKFAQRTAKVLALPLEYVDERLTSYQAKLLLAEHPASKQYKGLIDRKAASIILQQWLDERRTKSVIF